MADTTTPATWIKVGDGRWEDGSGYAITMHPGRRGPVFHVVRPDGRSWPDEERSLTAAQNAVAVAHAIEAGLL